MLTGARAFDGDDALSVRAAILEREPPPASSLQPQVPAAVDAIVRRCLARSPHERWPTAGEALEELKQASATLSQARLPAGRAWQWPAAVLVAVFAGLAAWLWTTGTPGGQAIAPASRIRSVAVLPLEDLSGETGQEYFADGMTEQLIADLTTIGALRVIARTSVMQYRGTSKPVPVIARELNVDAIIEGSLLRAGGTVRITAKLVEGTSAAVLWSGTFERSLRDMLALQRDVARAITSSVDIALTPPEQARLADVRSVDPDVHRQVLLGRHHAARGTEEGMRNAVEYFNRAIAMDAANAAAYAGLADAYIGLNGFYVPPRQAMTSARRAAETAIALDPALADAHAALGYIHLVYDWDGPAAAQALRLALDLNPALPIARLHYAAYLSTQARHDEAVREITRAIAFDPVSIRSNALATSLLLFAQRYDEAIELARRGLEFEPENAFALAFQGVAYAEQRRFEDAVDNMEQAATLDKSPTILALQAHVLAVAGRYAEARRVIREVEQAFENGYFCPYEIGTAYVSLGDADTAYQWFRKGIDDRADCMAWLGVEPWIAPFRLDPRYASLLKEIGLDPGAR
jgi:TolB-like protein/tetratricopeptide (TPR) repeat protein